MKLIHVIRVRHYIIFVSFKESGTDMQYDFSPLRTYIEKFVRKKLGAIGTHRNVNYSQDKDNGNNLMTYASKLKVDRGIPGEPILYLLGKYRMY